MGCQHLGFGESLRLFCEPTDCGKSGNTWNGMQLLELMHQYILWSKMGGEHCAINLENLCKLGCGPIYCVRTIIL